MITENKIELNFHKFLDTEPLGDKFLFSVINNREGDLKSSGIEEMKRVISNEYDNSEHGIQTTLKHKLIFNFIEKISETEGKYQVNENNELEVQNEKNPFVMLHSLKEKLLEEFKIGLILILKKRSATSKTSLMEDIGGMIERENLEEILSANSQIQNVLIDLHKLGKK